MPTVRAPSVALVAVLTVLAACARPARRAPAPDGATDSPCLTEAAAATTFLFRVTQTLTGLDSAGLARRGLPYRPAADSVTLVTDPATCAAVVRGLNGGLADPARVRRAYVMRIGRAGYAAVDEASAAGRPAEAYLDAAFRLVMVLVDVD